MSTTLLKRNTSKSIRIKRFMMIKIHQSSCLIQRFFLDCGMVFQRLRISLSKKNNDGSEEIIACMIHWMKVVSSQSFEKWNEIPSTAQKCGISSKTTFLPKSNLRHKMHWQRRRYCDLVGQNSPSRRFISKSGRSFFFLYVRPKLMGFHLQLGP